MPRSGAPWPYWEEEPPRYTCVADASVVHEGNEIEDCESCLPPGLEQAILADEPAVDVLEGNARVVHGD